MSSITFGKYINNNSFLTKLDARVKLGIMIVLLIFCFINFNIVGFSLLFGFLCLLMLIGKLSFKPLWNIIKHMWLLFVVLLIINLCTIKGEVLFELFGMYVYKDAILETIYVFFRIVMLLMISTLLSSSTTPSELTYALEFYLKPLGKLHVNVHEISIMISIALRFIPTLLDEMERIKKAQTSRGIDFENGKYLDKLRGLTSLIIPLFISCFDRADELTNAMIVRGYECEKTRTIYNRFSSSREDIWACIFVVIVLITIAIINGVVL